MLYLSNNNIENERKEVIVRVVALQTRCFTDEEDRELCSRSKPVRPDVHPKPSSRRPKLRG